MLSNQAGKQDRLTSSGHPAVKLLGAPKATETTQGTGGVSEWEVLWSPSFVGILPTVLASTSAATCAIIPPIR